MKKIYVFLILITISSTLTACGGQESIQTPDMEWMSLDSTIVRAHPCAAGALKKTEGSNMAMNERRE